MKKRVVAGRHASEEALRVNSRHVVELWVESLSSPVARLAQELGVRNVYQKKSKDLERFCFSHQGSVLFLKDTPVWDEVIPEKESQVWLGVDGINDPHNLGAVLRTAWLMGVEGVFVKSAKSTTLTPATHKVATGACEHIPVIFVSSLPQVIQKFQKHNFWVYALDAQGKQPLNQVNFPERVFWVLGSEDKGVSRPVLKVADEVVSIFQKVQGASYNMSVAVALALHASCIK